MSTMPPQKDEPDDMDAEYRRWSSNDPARPSDSVRAAVLAQAAHLAAERSSSLSPSRSRRGLYRWAAPVFGGLAAATLVGFLVIPRFIESGPRAVNGADALVARDVRPAAPREASPAATSEPAPASTIAANSPAALAESSASKPADNASSAAKARAKRASPETFVASVQEQKDSVVVTGSLAQPEAAPSISGGVAADSTSSARSAPLAPSAAFRPRAGFTATAGHNIDTGEALRRSANLGDLAGVAALLSGTIDIESRDSAGRTALMLAASSGRTAVVAALLSRGADPNATDSYGDTPLHAALAGNYTEIVNALRRAGAR